MNLPPALEKFLPIALLLAAVVVVVRRLPKVDLGHSDAFRKRRVMNWVPLGLAYSFLYFGRYNLSAIAGELDKAGILSKSVFNDIDGVGQWVYGVAFLLNGPLTDRFGGRKTMIAATLGSAVMNVGMALTFSRAQAGEFAGDGLRNALLALNAVNMYFQSFGAVSIVKVNAHWFHVRERGVLGGLFGILISLGLYFSYDWSLELARAFGNVYAFSVPAVVLFGCVAMAVAFVRDAPSDAGFKDFDTGDASFARADDEAAPTAREVLRRMFAQRVIWIIVGIEFCSGFLRQAVMKQYRLYSKAVEPNGSFVYENWGMLLCVAGILGGVFAGFISDHVFQSRRGPVSSVLYAGLLFGGLLALAFLGGPGLGWSVVFMSLCVIGVHGMLSGTASADFGGRKNAGLVVGIIDGFVYLGGGAQAFLYGRTLPKGEAAANPEAWRIWIYAMLPVAVLGLGLAATIWNAKPRKAGGH